MWVRFTTMILVASSAGFFVGTMVERASSSSMELQPTASYELRTYTSADGKHGDLLSRFRHHTMRIFEKHGMTSVGYWTPQDAPGADDTLIYLLSHPSREEARVNWEAFLADPEWQEVFEESRRDGPLITGLDRTFLEATDFSPMH